MGSLTIHLFLLDFERVLVGGKGGGVEGERVLGIPEQDGHHWLEEQLIKMEMLVCRVGQVGCYESELGEILGTRAVLRVTGGDNNGLCCDATRPSPGFRWVGKGLDRGFIMRLQQTWGLTGRGALVSWLEQRGGGGSGGGRGGWRRGGWGGGRGCGCLQGGGGDYRRTETEGC